jgi:peroxiredoxin/mono/diheme cytochrome c family protein
MYPLFSLSFLRRFGPWLLGFLLPVQLWAASPRAVSDFSLIDLRGRNVELYRAEGRAVVLFFTGVGCPIARKSVDKLHQLNQQFGSQGVHFWIVNTYPNDTTREAAKEAMELGVHNLTYLCDPRQLVALSLGVERTAEVVVIGLKDHKVVYQGAIDDQLTEGAERPAPQKKFLETALTEFLEGKPVATARTPARGCRISFTPAAEAAEPPSYAKDVAPLLRQQCVECHRDGGIGPWAMDSYGKVKNYARMIEEVILTRRMPPYDAHPDYGQFANAHRLSREETQTLLRWIEAGSLRGEGPDPLAETLPALADWPLGKPDVVMRLPQPESVPATGVLDYRHIAVPNPLTNEFWLAGVDIRPGNRRVVHHAILYAQWPGCPDDGSGNGVHIFGWAPGATPAAYPEGVGKRIPAGAEFKLEMHYTTAGSPQTDQTEVALYLRPGPQAREAETRQVAEYRLEIPPGESEARHYATYAFKAPATIYSLSPHMHFRGKWMRYELLLPNGKRETLLHVPRYDFKWQLTYRLAEPRKVPAGSWLLVTGAFDNSAANPANPDPTKFVTFGLQSWDEMFIGFFDAADEPKSSGTASAGQP